MRVQERPEVGSPVPGAGHFAAQQERCNVTLTIEHRMYRNNRETDRPFPEPAMFLLNEDGLLHMSDYSNSPFCHPDIRILIEGGFK